MPELKNKGLQKHMKRIILDRNLFCLGVDTSDYSNSIDDFLDLSKDLREKNIEFKKTIGFDNKIYYLQLYSKKGPVYINEQLKKFKEQQNA